MSGTNVASTPCIDHVSCTLWFCRSCNRPSLIRHRCRLRFTLLLRQHSPCPIVSMLSFCSQYQSSCSPEHDHTVENASSLNHTRGHKKRSQPAYFLPLFFSWVSFSTFLTIFCSSIRKARTIRSRTQLAHLEPPYARDTDFWVLDTLAYCLGRRAGIYRGRYG